MDLRVKLGAPHFDVTLGFIGPSAYAAAEANATTATRIVLVKLFMMSPWRSVERHGLVFGGARRPSTIAIREAF
jgi:hypothetical protein